MKKQTLTIIGNGRFGKTLYHLLKDDFAVTIYTRKGTITLEEAYQNNVIFYAVPIAAFENVIQSHKQFFRPEHILIDVLSVKMHPAKILKKYLKNTKIQALLTHPMFGPDSSRDGFSNLPLVIDKFMANDETYAFWKKYFQKKHLRVIEMSADEHDRIAADSQGLTHFIGRLLDSFGMQETTIDSLGTKKLLEVEEQTRNDTWELFTNLQHFNPYTKAMRLRLGERYDKLYNKLLPKQINNEFITIGIQGGKGSFNEEAIQYYLQNKKITHYKIVYLYTSMNVMKQLHEGNIDQGLMATHNSVGGIVFETIEALAKYKCTIVTEFSIKIAHALMIHKDAQFEDVSQIMAHPQVFAQCVRTLTKKYPTLQQVVGKGKYIDHAYVAQQLSEGKLPKNIAVMGSKILANIYNLKIVEDNLQDAAQNDTSFLLVER